MHRFHRLSHRSGRLAALFLVLVSGSGPAVLASSHREAPFITQRPQADNTDAYAFRSFEPGREDFLVAIANFNPLEEPYGGPIYYPSAAGTRYEIHIDASGNGLADFTFTVEFMPSFSSHTVTTDDGTEVESPLTYNHPNQITGVFDSNNAVLQPYTLSITSAAGTNPAVNVTHSSTAFFKPFDNIGTDVFPDYPFYSDSHVSDFDESFGSGLLGRVFFGARRDPYVESAAVSRFESPTLPESNIFGGHNVLSLALELPINVLTGD